ncbi:MAG TPA: hypothetical protein PLD93_03190 [Synergistaceae bacterium]|nr:hypothetical protein [Synergistaceae bacterium]
MKTFNHIYIDIYEINIYWCRCSRQSFVERCVEVFGKELPDISDRWTDGSFYSWKQSDGRCIGVIWLKNRTLSTRVHECFHAVKWIMDQQGLWLTDSSEEAYAYLLTYLFEKTK